MLEPDANQAAFESVWLDRRGEPGQWCRLGSGGFRPWLNGVQRAGPSCPLVLELSVAVPRHRLPTAQLAHDELGHGHGQDAVIA